MMRVVADASFCGAWFLEDESSVVAEELLASVETGLFELIIPALWHYEILNLLRSALRRKRLTRKSVLCAAELLGRIPIRNVDLPDAVAQRRTLELAIQHNLSAYDAAYLELALRFQATLRTNDAELMAAARAEGLTTCIR
jgi:predicted nucleic acid-binding protein